MFKVNYFTNPELNREEKHHRSYECFGWWLPDLLSNEIHPSIGSPEIFHSEEYDSGVSFEKSQVVSDESLTSGSHWGKTDLNSNVAGLDNGNVGEETLFDEEVTIQNELVEETNRNSLKSNESLLNSKFNNVESEEVWKYENHVIPATSREHLIALINSDLPNSKQLEKIFRSISETALKNPSPVNTPTPSNIGKKRTKLCKKSQIKVYENMLQELACTAEHEATDRDLEESRSIFFKAASDLDSRLTALEMDSQQLHSDINDLQRDFQNKEVVLARMTQEARRLVSDLQNIRYLDDLIFLLQGQLDRITLQKWPFVLSHVLPPKDSSQELNLVV